ncbi:hypothetical protein [Chelatococcus asaccharovorans]|uniref:hypothetical protein n=1 Tax=Chelatococcus asaccharovorans TaxID=28210 RepID=UPI000D76564A|nr:hypothetical protein [Chelatococcus asaccharovorans]MBS7703973.1 hypothetical protein [Chelatococcus asaccharovorans]
MLRDVSKTSEANDASALKTSDIETSDAEISGTATDGGRTALSRRFAFEGRVAEASPALKRAFIGFVA